MAPTPVLLPGETHGRRSLVGYSSWGHKETRLRHFTFTFTFTYMCIYMASQGSLVVTKLSASAGDLKVTV